MSKIPNATAYVEEFQIFLLCLNEPNLPVTNTVHAVFRNYCENTVFRNGFGWGGGGGVAQEEVVVEMCTGINFLWHICMARPEAGRWWIDR